MCPSMSPPRALGSADVLGCTSHTQAAEPSSLCSTHPWPSSSPSCCLKLALCRTSSLPGEAGTREGPAPHRVLTSLEESACVTPILQLRKQRPREAGPLVIELESRARPPAQDCSFSVLSPGLAAFLLPGWAGISQPFHPSSWQNCWPLFVLYLLTSSSPSKSALPTSTPGCHALSARAPN